MVNFTKPVRLSGLLHCFNTFQFGFPKQLLHSEVILPSFIVADRSKANITTNKNYKNF